jgi:hypothetical protein
MEWNNELELVIGCTLYIVYIVGINWSYITEYTKGNGVIKRGTEWDNDWHPDSNL